MKSLIINYLSILFCVQVFFACTPDVKKNIRTDISNYPQQ